jgi:hypothetical protein
MIVANEQHSASEQLSDKFLNLGQHKTVPPTYANYENLLNSAQSDELRQVFKKHFGFEPEKRPVECKKHAMSLWKADELSDRALVALVHRGINPHEAINGFLDKGISAIQNPPEEFLELWAQVTIEPEWLDWALLERGARIYRRYGVLGFMFQGIGSIDSYRNENIAKTLMSTGQYADDTAFKRFVLTSNFWTKVSEPGGMRSFAPGWKVAIQVRLLHTLIRRAVLGSKNWDSEKLGMPINQVGLLGAPLISSVMMGQHLKMLGYRPTDSDIEAMMHLWRYVAHVMGRDVSDFPTTANEGLQVLYDLSNVSENTDTPEGARIGKSFIEAFKPRSDARGFGWLKEYVQYKINIAQSLFFVSPQTRKAMNLPNPTFWGALYWMVRFPINRWTDKKRYDSSEFENAYDKRVARERYVWLNEHIKGSSLEYRPQPKY